MEISSVRGRMICLLEVSEEGLKLVGSKCVFLFVIL